MSAQFIQFEGAKLYIETNGDPSHPVLLLWPPGGSTIRVWDHFIPTLERSFHTVRIDVRGYGQSKVEDLHEEQFTFQQYARDAYHVLDRLGHSTVHVWSQSWGTRAAIVFCTMNRDIVLSAALYAANLDLPDVAAQRQGTKQAAEERQSLGIQSAPAPTGFNEHVNPDAARLTASALRKVELGDVIDDLTMPALIGTGNRDPNLTSSRRIAARLAKAHLVEFEHVGHNAILEHPDLAIQTFLDFHASLSTSRVST